MRKAALMFNPVAGMRRTRRRRDLAAIAGVLNASGVDTVTLSTRGTAEATAAVVREVAAACDAIVACGGDGTLNEILQGVMRAEPKPAVGVIPMGCGNLLAKELGIQRDPVRAAGQLLGASLQPVPIGVIDAEAADGSRVRRYWTVATGVGADARVICQIDADTKSRFGIYAYYAESARQLFFEKALFPPFVVEFTDTVRRRRRMEVVTQVVAQRVTYFGRCLAELSPGEFLASPDLQLILIKTNRRWAYIHYGARLLASRLGARPGAVRDVELVDARDVVCRTAGPADAMTWGRNGNDAVLAETDGEFVGRLPLRLSIQENGFNLLRPAASTPLRPQ